MGFIAWIIIGGLAGWIASKVMGTDAQQGVIMNIVVGILGGLLGGWLLGAFGARTDGINIVSFLTAFVGACILLFGYKLVAGRK